MIRVLRLSVITLSLAAAGCVATAPTGMPSAQDVSVQREFSYAPDTATAQSLDALLPQQDPAFRQLAEAANSNAPQLAQALARVEAARARARGAGANRKPQVTGDVSTALTRINPDQFGADLPPGASFDTDRVQSGNNVTASWDPDLFGVLEASERAALANAEASAASAAAIRLALTSEIAAQVVDWRALSERESSLRSDLASAQRLAQLAGSRERAGLAPGFDRLRAEAAASSTETRLTALQSERASIAGRLIALTGESSASVMGALAQPATPSAPVAPPPSLPSQLLENRPDVLAAAAQLDAADAALAAAARRRFPRLTLSAALGLLTFDFASPLSENALVGSASGALLAPLFDFGRIQSEIDASAADQRVAFEAYRGAVFTALGEAETAYGLVEATNREVAASQAERAKLVRNASLAETRYRAGLADFLTVLEARRAANASAERTAAAKGRAARARVLLWQALGGSAD